MNEASTLKKRWFYLIVAVLAMLVSGIIYAWSILKTPLTAEFGWEGSALALNYTLLMSFFCLGIISGGILVKKTSPAIPLFLAALMVGGGFFITSQLSGSSIVLLYIGYAVLSGAGIGIAYNTIVTTVGNWFPDKKGLSSGIMMLGFGFSTLILGNLAGQLFETPGFGWRKTYMLLAALIAVVLIITGLILKKPPQGTEFPAPKQTAKNQTENTIKAVDIGTAQMLRSTTFWEIYIYTTLLHCVGMTVISFARDLFVSYGADAALAVSLVGLVSICNGGIRIVIGWMYDNLGRRFSVLFTNELVIAAAGFILLGIFCDSLLLVAIGACFAGCSYGCLPTTEVVLMRSFYGERDFSTNFGIVSTCIIPASFMSTLSGSLISNSGSYTSVFVILLACSIIAMAFTFAIRRV